MNISQHSHEWNPVAQYEGRMFVGRTFANLNLVGTTFSRVKFVRCIFDSCDFSHTRFANCDVYDCSFDKCILYFSQLENCELTKTRFAGSYLSGIRLRSCDLTRTQFGNHFLIGKNRKLEPRKGALPAGVYVSSHASEIPRIEHMENNYTGIAVENCPWYIAFIAEDAPGRIHRRRSVLAAHLANELLSFGRGDSGHYYYLARRNAALAESSRTKRLVSKFEDWLWGYGTKPLRLFRAGMIANMIVILLYALVTVSGWGHLTDNEVILGANPATSLGVWIYYCVVVATTLGFGDVLPVGAGRAVLCAQIATNVVLVAMWLSTLSSPHREWAIPELTE